MDIPSVSPAVAARAIAAGEATLFDVRTPAEFGELHADGAQNVPLDRLDPARLQHDDKPLYVICRSGGRGRQACTKLLGAGHSGVANIEGGTLAWEAAGLPVVRGRKAMSLERQVRIAAGSLVLVGIGLGLAVHPACFGLAAFVGAGLVFAGVTDTCGMGMLLARMPWNRVAASAAGASCAVVAKGGAS
ncbi:MAG: rhodanese-like domain-containing protein [Gemmataceae bacterium]